MSIIFFGKKGSYNYHKIGGVDAIVRRLSNQLSQNIDNVFLLTYGNEVRSEEVINNKIVILKERSFEQSLLKIKELQADHIIITYLDQKDRGPFKTFQKVNQNLSFSLLLTVFHQNPVKRWAAYGQAISNPYYKYFLCISDRIHKAVQKLSKRAILFLPPVDDNFYVNSHPIQNNKFHVGYMGRLDLGKGADIAIRFFEKSQLNRVEFEFSIFSYPWKTDSESMKLHEHLQNQSAVNYKESKVKKYTFEVDENLKSIIDSVDVFFLPYRTLSTTIDTPLVPLEILSRDKLFISTDEGIISSLIADKKLLVKATESIENLDELIRYCKANYQSIQQKNKNLKRVLDYKTSSISKILTELV